MVRALAAFLIACGSLIGPTDVRAQVGSIPSPRLYELMIDAESFTVEADRQVRLESKEKPGVTYTVALRISPQQPLELNRLRFDYDWPAEVHDDRGRQQRTVRVRPELGYTLLITDLGEPLDTKAQEEAFGLVSQSVLKGLGESGMQKIASSQPYDRQFASAKGRGMTIRYEDKEGLEETCLVYLLVGAKFTCSCVVQYFSANGETVLPRIKATLDSVRPRR